MRLLTVSGKHLRDIPLMDIATLSNLLNEFISKEVEILNEQDIKHPITIGTMYEGLTEDVLNRSIFQGLNLKVVKNSFIIGCDIEFDVLLVEGEGEKIPYTERYKFKPEQVIAVIQAKKNLYSKDIEEGYNNLKFLIDYFEPKQPEPFVGRLFRDAFRGVCRKDVTSRKAGELTEQEEIIFHILRVEAFLPVRIVWGYNGFASEYSLRTSFVDYLQKNLTQDLNNKIGGFGPHNFPNLIICGKYSMIKQNGMPFSCPLFEDNWWPFYTTSSINPTKFFLELIWTRLSYKFDQLPTDIFGEDLEMEPANRFLECHIKEVNRHQGWEYNYTDIKETTLKENLVSAEWEPAVLDNPQFVVINELCKKGEIDLDADKELEAFVKKSSYSSLNEFIEELKKTGLVFVETNKLKLLTDQCQCAILPDGRYVAGENKSERFTKWVLNQIDKNKRK